MTTLTRSDTEPDVSLVWDYAQIEDECPAEIIQAAASQIKLVFRRTLENIIEIGKLLAVVREHLPHGHWGNWLEHELGMSSSSACNYLNAYEHRDEFRAVGNWSAGAAFLLTGASAPDDAIEQANQIAESGERVTKEAAKQIVSGDSTRDPAETETAADPEPPAEINHDVDRTRLAPEPASTSETSDQLKLARAVWSNLRRLAEINASGAETLAMELWNELKVGGELQGLGDGSKPCDVTLRSFLGQEAG